MAQGAYVKSYTFSTGETTDGEEVTGTSSYAFQTDTVAGSLTTYSMQLQGSLDGVSWFVLVAQTQTGARLAWVVDKSVKYVRVHADIAGTDLTVTATVLAV